MHAALKMILGAYSGAGGTGVVVEGADDIHNQRATNAAAAAMATLQTSDSVD